MGYQFRLSIALLLLTRCATANDADDWLLLDHVEPYPSNPWGLADTPFQNPTVLRDQFGYNAQAVRGVGTASSFAAIEGGPWFPSQGGGQRWQQITELGVRGKIARAKAAGLQVFSVDDFFMWPKLLVDRFRDEIVGRTAGAPIDYARARTREILQAQIDEVASFGVDGMVVRVGESYPEDFPFHTGGSAVFNHSSAACYSGFIALLRELVCERHGLKLLFRTWYPSWRPAGNLHVNPVFYREVTDAVPPHPKLYMSIKHQANDYLRFAPFNPTLGIGQHNQVVEVSCQRSYEGKGAYPNYIMAGVIDGFSENANCSSSPRCAQGISSVVGTGRNLVKGVYSWSRGDGWSGGPDILQSEFWVRAHVFVLSKWFRSRQDGSTLSEEAAFLLYAASVGLGVADAKALRTIALLSAEAELGTYPMAAWSEWKRDCWLSGLNGFNYSLVATNSSQLQRALERKQLMLRQYEQIARLGSGLVFNTNDGGEAAARFHTSLLYGQLLHEQIAHGFAVLALGTQGTLSDRVFDTNALCAAADQYAAAVAGSKALLTSHVYSSSLFLGKSFPAPGGPGMDDDVLAFTKLANCTQIYT
jgi:hypothetical protein